MVAMGHGSPVDLGLGNPAWTLRAWNNEMEDLFNKSSCAPLVLQTGPGGSSRGKFKGQRDQSRIYRAASSVHTEYVVYMHYGIFYHLRRTKCRVYTYGPLRRENKGTEEAKVCLRQIPALLFFFFFIPFASLGDRTVAISNHLFYFLMVMVSHISIGLK